MTNRAGDPPAARRERLLRALWREKLHVDREALQRSPATVRERYEHIWAPADHLLARLEPLPDGLLSQWLASERGHLLLSHAASAYAPGHQEWRGHTFGGLTTIALSDLADETEALWRTLLALLDHLLGSDGKADNPWLSDGAGINAALRDVGRRFQQIAALGYGHTALGIDTPHGYFSATWALYLRDPATLNRLDPLAERLYRGTLMSDAWWRRNAPIDSASDP